MLIVNPGFLFFSDVNKPKQEPEKNPTKRPSGKLDLESNEMLIYIPQYKIYHRFEDFFLKMWLFLLQYVSAYLVLCNFFLT